MFVKCMVCCLHVVPKFACVSFGVCVLLLACCSQKLRCSNPFPLLLVNKSFALSKNTTVKIKMSVPKILSFPNHEAIDEQLGAVESLLSASYPNANTLY
jgi:hypothetical protein